MIGIIISEFPWGNKLCQPHDISNCQLYYLYVFLDFKNLSCIVLQGAEDQQLPNLNELLVNSLVQWLSLISKVCNFEHNLFSVKKHFTVIPFSRMALKRPFLFSLPHPHNCMDQPLFQLKRTARHPDLSQGAISSFGLVSRVFTCDNHQRRIKVTRLIKIVR